MTSSRSVMAGQALVEALLGLVCLGVLFVLIAMLGRLQDLGLQSSFASRYAAFSSARRDVGASELRQEIGNLFFHPDRQRWGAWDGGAMVRSDQGNLAVETTVDSQPNVAIQIGGADATAKVLREELTFPDRGASTSRVSILPRLAASPTRFQAGSPSYTGLAEWAQMKLAITRYLVILTGAGHARSDEAVQAAIASSDHAWRSAAERSQRSGTAVNGALRRIDEPWHRPAVSFDWLQPWSDLIPADRLGASNGGAP